MASLPNIQRITSLARKFVYNMRYFLHRNPVFEAEKIICWVIIFITRYRLILQIPIVLLYRIDDKTELGCCFLFSSFRGTYTSTCTCTINWPVNKHKKWQATIYLACQQNMKMAGHIFFSILRPDFYISKREYFIMPFIVVQICHYKYKGKRLSGRRIKLLQ